MFGAKKESGVMNIHFFQLVLRRDDPPRVDRPPDGGEGGRSVPGPRQRHHPGRLRLVRQVSLTIS